MHIHMFDLYECIKLFQRNAWNTDSEYNKVTRIFNWITLYVPNVLKELYLIKVMCLLWERKFSFSTRYEIDRAHFHCCIFPQ